MSPGLIALVLFAAILHASWNALVKSGGSPLYSIAAYILVSGIVSLCLVWLVPPPPAWWRSASSSSVTMLDSRKFPRLL